MRIHAAASLRMRRGSRVAEVLAGTWRDAPPPLLSRGALAEVTPLLLKSGAGGLGWWRVRHSDVRGTRAAFRLRQAYRLHSLQAALHERQIERSVALLRSASVDPLLGKGWAAARLYPVPGLRPYGDIDLYVPAAQHSCARETLTAPRDEAYPVDLHRGFHELDDRRAEDLYGRSRSVEIGRTEVRTFGPEDHLRLLSLHLLRHGAWRPLWLCDIAAALESRTPEFDWDYLRRGSRRRSHWVACVLELAHRLLGARLDDVPAIWRRDLPRWLVPSVLRQWGSVETPHGCRTAMASYLRRPAGVLEALRVRWPNAIEATVAVGGPFNDLPRMPFQVAECLARTARFVARLPRELRLQP